MKKVIQQFINIVVLLMSLLVIGACSNPSASTRPVDNAQKDAGCPADRNVLVSKDSHAGHNHAKAERSESEQTGHEIETEKSDLDKSVDELLALTCEHDIKTYECDECRYEVGVVKAKASLFEQGLMKLDHASLMPIKIPVQLTGEVQFDERKVAQLSAQTEGIIKKVYVGLGEEVVKDQTLLEIASTDAGEASGEYREAFAGLELVQKNFDRVQALYQDGIVSEKEFNEAKHALDAAQIRMESSAGRVQQLGIARADSSHSASQTPRSTIQLRAPISGIVLALKAVPGEFTRSEEPFITIGNIASVWVWADLYEQDLAVVMESKEKGDLRALLNVKAYPKDEFEGKVDFISPLMDTNSRTVKLRITVDNAKGKLFAGMFASVNLLTNGDEEVLAAPSDAILEDEGRQFVFLHHHDDYYIRRPVNTGRSWAGFTEIKAGLSENEKLVAQGAFLMKSDVLRSKMGAGCAD